VSDVFNGIVAERPCLGCQEIPEAQITQPATLGIAFQPPCLKKVACAALKSAAKTERRVAAALA